jgi:hypothetical protein
MKSKLLMAAWGAGALALGVIVPCASAGTEVIQDYGGRDFSQTQTYAPPPPRPVYYAPPPVPVVVYPTFGYYHRPLRVYGYRRPYLRHHRHWY